MIEIRILRMPLKGIFQTSAWEEKDREFILIGYHRFGITGYGEVVASRAPYYSPETVRSAYWVLVEHLIPLLGDDLEPADFITKAKKIRGNRMAKAGIELALYDHKARMEGKPLFELYGGIGGEIEVGVSVGIKKNPRELINTIRFYLDQGYHRIKVKIRKGWDLDVLKRLRSEFPRLRLWADANGSYDKTDIQYLKKIDDFGLELLEQPFRPDDLLSHAQLRNLIRTRICLDESIRSVEELRTGLVLGALDILNLKVGRIGGITESLKILKECEKRNLLVWLGGMLESGIGRAHNLHLASNPILSLPPDLSASDRYYEADLIYPPFMLKDGKIRVPEAPGIGVVVREELINRYTIHREEIRPP